MAEKICSNWQKPFFEEVERIREGWKIDLKDFVLVAGVSERHYRRMRSCKCKAKREMQRQIVSALRRMNPKCPLDVLIDYVRVRFSYVEKEGIENVCRYVLKIPFERFECTGAGWSGYESKYEYGHIYLCTSSNEEMGMIIELKGQGCRQFEQYLIAENRTWLQFFQSVNMYGGIYKRLDLAINDRYGILDVYELHRLCREGALTGYCRKFEFVASGELSAHEKPEMGNTLYVGKRGASEVYFCIYEKDYEQQVRTGLDRRFFDIKNRFEIRLSNDRAATAVEQFQKEYESWVEDAEEDKEQWEEKVIFGIINYYLRFCILDERKQKSKWDTYPVWRLFIGEFGRDRMRLAKAPEPFNERRTRNWLSHQPMPSMKALLVKDYEEGKTDTIDMINDAKPSRKLLKILEMEEEVAEKVKVKLEGEKIVYDCEG